jgi:hypothetical protein
MRTRQDEMNCKFEKQFESGHGKDSNAPATLTKSVKANINQKVEIEAAVLA